MNTHKSNLQLMIMIIAAICAHINMQAQQLDVEGHSQIAGNLSLHHMSDTSSVHIGLQAGTMVDFTVERENTLVGSAAGSEMSTGRGNSFFGRSAGRSNTSGSSNSFFGRDAGRFHTTGFDNAFFGTDAGKMTESSGFNSFFGRSAGRLNTTGGGNCFFGFASGDANTVGKDNSFFGRDAGGSNTDGQDNSYFGALAGWKSAGNENSFFGKSAGLNNSSGSQNSFFGIEAGYSNGSAVRNNFMGRRAGYKNSTGSDNCFMGVSAGLNNVSGNDNTFVGNFSGQTNSTGRLNVFIGRDAGKTNFSGWKNTVVGVLADVSDRGLENATALGYGAIVNTSHKVRIGNTKIEIIEGQVNFTASSDLRLKEAIQEVPLGIDFILDLRPVSYQRKGYEDKSFEMGFIAQEVEAAVLQHTNDRMGLVQQLDDTYLGMRYTDLLAPLVKSIQSLKAENNNLESQLEFQQRQIEDLVKRLDQLEQD